MSSIFQTDPSFSFLILRVGLAVAYFAHGSQHLLAWFDGRGFKATINNWQQKNQIPKPIGVIGIFTEFVGSFALLVGFFTRPFALGLTIFILVAAQKSHWKHGFFLAHRQGEGSGIEYCLALFFMSLALLVGGGGAISIDGLLSQ